MGQDDNEGPGAGPPDHCIDRPPGDGISPAKKEESVGPPVSNGSRRDEVSPHTIYNRLSAGTFTIKTKRIGHRVEWDRQDVDHYLDKLPIIN